MPILLIALILIIIAVGVWLVGRLIKDPQIYRVLQILVLVAVILWLLHIFGFWGYLQSLTV